jgi:hypothetical protein
VLGALSAWSVPGVYPNFGELGPDSYDDETLMRLRDLIAT